jgi:hypothetical protein
MNAKEEAQKKINAMVQRNLDEVRFDIRTNKRAINALADKQKILKKTRLELTLLLRAVTVKPKKQQ